MLTRVKNTYYYLVSIPDRLYPFSCEIEGRWVRGREAYMDAVEKALKQNGFGHLGYKLMIYRSTFHFLGSIIFIVSATLISQELFSNEISLYVVLGMAILALSFQEFYLHPRRYGQRTQKGMTDWFVWVLPMLAYIVFF